MAEKRARPGQTLSFEWSLPPSPPAPAPSASSPPAPSPASSLPPASPSLSASSPVEASWVPPPLPVPATPVVPEGPRVLTVAQLGRVVARTLERQFAAELWVEGEVSGARPASSGHIYFCLKDQDEEAVVDIVLYRSQVTPRVRGLVKDGARVRIRGKPTYWSPRGKLQFIGDRVEPTGKGALLEALEKLKEKLRAEGLFDAERKRPLPHDPRVIGVVTSATGAVIHDICKVAFRRGSARILLAPAQVQGLGAAESIRRGLKLLQQVEAVDVVIIGRGGGSQDDLLAFNDEALVRDVAACRVPIVSAVGHEVDVTLVDFAADARAATPSQAAELVVPDAAARRSLLDERSQRLHRAMTSRIAEERVVTARLARAFGDPRLLIASAQQRIDEHIARLERIVSQRLAREREATSRIGARLGAAHPRERIARDRARLAELAQRITTRVQADLRERGSRSAVLAHRIEAFAPRLVRDRREQTSVVAHRLDALAPRIVRQRRDALVSLAHRLDAMSPLKVLGRGYAIVTRADGHAVRAAAEVAPGDTVHVRVEDGSFDATVTRRTEEEESS